MSYFKANMHCMTGFISPLMVFDQYFVCCVIHFIFIIFVSTCALLNFVNVCTSINWKLHLFVVFITRA